jgi:5-methylcytosine-specific restriction protein B
MKYIRNIFRQDLRDGKQIAFPKEPSNFFFEFDYNGPDEDRQISFTFKEDDSTSKHYSFNDTVIKTRLYAAGSEARIDGELKQFLRDSLNTEVDDIIVFSKRRNVNSFEFKFASQNTINYNSYKSLLNGNHELIIENDSSVVPIPLKNDVHYYLDEFVEWFIKLDGQKHNYFTDSFNSNKENVIEGFKKYEEEYQKQFNDKVFSLHASNLKEEVIKLENNLYQETGNFFDYSSRISNHMPRAILGKKNYLKFLNDKSISQTNFNISAFHEDCTTANLKYSNQLVTRYISSLVTKPFVLLSGLSGSGKTKLAQSFAQWLCEDKSQYCIVPVGADWTNREPLLGYVNALDNKEYILPENGALQLIIEANKEENENKPYFLILDEMNLSHVERYFADFLSVMESKDKFKLHSSESNLNITNGDKFEKSIEVPSTLSWPKNLFVVGTVNIDETTYMFSPKVLDRANVIEFRINETEMGSYLSEATDVTDLNGEGKSMGESFVTIATKKTKANSETLKNTLNDFFRILQEVGAEFGYRTASEIQTLFGQIDIVSPNFKETDDFKENYSSEDNYKIDIAIMQKLLPKLHGSRSKLVPVLEKLANICIAKDPISLESNETIFEKIKKESLKGIYPISLEKITRMYNNVVSNGFTSYAEA